MEKTQTTFWHDKKTLLACGLFLIYLFWRGALYFQTPTDDFNLISFIWGATYQIIAILGIIIGFGVAQHWGGIKSSFGKTILLFSIGLLFQSIGQAISSYYVYLTGEVPYPGLGDIGFFGSIIFYIFGAFMLARVVGGKAFIKAAHNKVIALVIPLVMVILSYWLFLKGYEYDWSNPLQTFLDFGYPIYQAIYVGIAIVTLILSRTYLGGLMKTPVILFLIALIMQYLSDFVFLYQASRGLYIPEGTNDLMYFTSYFLMTLALIYTGNVFKKISES
jgi:hypothetical protein